MIFVYIVHCAVVYESTGMTVYISWKIVGLLWIYGIMDFYGMGMMGMRVVRDSQ